MTDASICVLTLNQIAVTRLCLASLADSDLPPGTEIILVDNGSTDGTVELLQRFQQDASRPGLDIVVTLNSHNRGCPGGRNMAAALARRDHLIFIDNDVEIHDPQWVQKTSRTLENGTGIGVMGAVLVYADPPLRVQCLGVTIDADANVGFISENAAPPQPQPTLSEVQGVPGAFFALRRTLFHDLGGFDDAYHPGNYEDLDVCFKARASGLRVVCNHDLIAYHHAHSTTMNTPGISMRRVNVLNQRTFCDRWAETLRDDQKTLSPVGG